MEGETHARPCGQVWSVLCAAGSWVRLPVQTVWEGTGGGDGEVGGTYRPDLSERLTASILCRFTRLGFVQGGGEEETISMV